MSFTRDSVLSTQSFLQGLHHTQKSRQRQGKSTAFFTDFEHLTCRRGSLIRTAHDVVLWGLAQGCVTAVNGDEITLDEPVPMEVAGNYAIRLRFLHNS